MDFRVSYKHMNSSPALTAYARNKLVERIEKYVKTPIEAHVTFSIDRDNHVARCNILAGNGFNLHVESSDDYMYTSVDRLATKLEVRLRRQKEKFLVRKGGKKISQHFPEKIMGNDSLDDMIDASDVIALEKARLMRRIS